MKQYIHLMTLLNKQANDGFEGSNYNAHVGFMAGNILCVLT